MSYVPKTLPAGVTKQDPTGYAYSDSYTYEQPGAAAATQGMRDLQTGAVTGLEELLGSDYDANRQQFQDALYAGQEEALTRAQQDQMDQMAEGQFGSGMGLSTRTQDMTGELSQQYYDALSRANRESYIAAGTENRNDLAAQLGLYGTGFNAATQGLQSEANVGMTNAARLQQDAQFQSQLEAQQEAMALQAQQMAATTQFNYAQLAQQASQYGATLDYNTQQALMNRAQQMSLAQMQQGYNYAQLNQQGQIAGNALAYNYANLAQQGSQFQQGLTQQQQNANNQMLSGGISAGLGGLASLFSPWTTQSLYGSPYGPYQNLLPQGST